MRLLQRLLGSDYKLTSFNDDDPLPYAILSHTWTEGQEVTHNELVTGIGKDKTGYNKIRFCGGQASADGLEYFWVDTCCIDKSTSNELSTAINSMFCWYQRASKCYVYLSDVSVPDEVTNAEVFRITWAEAFRRSRWFTRGWTLQELLAPASVEFFSREGKRLGSRISLEQDIHEITRIPMQVAGLKKKGKKGKAADPAPPPNRPTTNPPTTFDLGDSGVPKIDISFGDLGSWDSRWGSKTSWGFDSELESAKGKDADDVWGSFRISRGKKKKIKKDKEELKVEELPQPPPEPDPKPASVDDMRAMLNAKARTGGKVFPETRLKDPEDICEGPSINQKNKRDNDQQRTMMHPSDVKDFTYPSQGHHTLRPSHPHLRISPSGSLVSTCKRPWI